MPHRGVQQLEPSSISKEGMYPNSIPIMTDLAFAAQKVEKPIFKNCMTSSLIRTCYWLHHTHGTVYNVRVWTSTCHLLNFACLNVYSKQIFTVLAKTCYSTSWMLFDYFCDFLNDYFNDFIPSWWKASFSSGWNKKKLESQTDVWLLKPKYLFTKRRYIRSRKGKTLWAPFFIWIQIKMFWRLITDILGCLVYIQLFLIINQTIN